MIFEPFAPFVSSEFQLKYVTEAWERREAAALRREVFCREQKIFETDDRDAIDEAATTIVGLSSHTLAFEAVVGTVRIHEETPGLWWGSRLAVAKPYRRIGALGPGLIRLAVSSAHARGCTTFLAHVQAANAMLFQRLHWDVVEPIDLHGRPHFLMRADLAHYPAFATPETGFRAFRRAEAA
ncbi:MSMEG_0567/Sll0786 family nitrogen starvation N-acetyltransferase [Chenggangzhangella methanolivorans]|uniref:Histone acetyltransferase n=1 Tax=Chenggangzhangella methanolivorans TaxID=1437009 RepID=A0A9E6R9P1_9HYPH|nr:MSMEG_0567/Sll0786 family nitrogen starvation N-acetyltransferase [Chenggangzhangella methanolivorans]QZN99393.1 histone acetyltransferase [Chenggangzhangella methanolivorans]